MNIFGLKLLWLMKNGVFGRRLRCVIENQNVEEELQRMKFKESELGDLSYEYEKKGVEILSYLDKEYPKGLKMIEDYPPLIFIKGNKKSLENKFVAVIGSRECSRNAGLKVENAVSLIVSLKMSVASGLAVGVDTLALRSVVSKKIPSVAVLAHGLDLVYPKENEKLSIEILKTGGALISELPLGVKPQPFMFLERNRIMVGLSRVVLVVESKRNSGTMASVNKAVEYGREVFVMLGSEGTDMLRAEGFPVWE